MKVVGVTSMSPSSVVPGDVTKLINVLHVVKWDERRAGRHRKNDGNEGKKVKRKRH
jgi:hypothetical protein